jgi:hypothetical protein
VDTVSRAEFFRIFVMDFLRRRTIANDVQSPSILTLYKGWQVSTGERGQLTGHCGSPGGSGGFFRKIRCYSETDGGAAGNFSGKYGRRNFVLIVSGTGFFLLQPEPGHYFSGSCRFRPAKTPVIP